MVQQRLPFLDASINKYQCMLSSNPSHIVRGGLTHSHCLNISGQPGQPDVQSLPHGEDLLEVCGDHLSLDAEPSVRSDRHTVLPPHGHDGTPVIRHDRLKKQRLQKILNCQMTGNFQRHPSFLHIFFPSS